MSRAYGLAEGVTDGGVGSGGWLASLEPLDDILEICTYGLRISFLGLECFKRVIQRFALSIQRWIRNEDRQCFQ